jgi:AGCS family alanine or glycine:cation symporter
MTQTFIDTLVVCSVTALAILTTGALATGETGAALTTAAFNQGLPVAGGLIVALSIILFAYSTILGWCYYGEKCLEYLLGEKAVPYYRYIFVLAVFVGAVAKLDFVWTFADVMNGLMAVPNLIGLLGLSGVVVAETNRFLNAAQEELRTSRGIASGK